MIINQRYASLLKSVLEEGKKKTTRNHETYSNIRLAPLVIDSLPLVTVRKTAWKKSLKELEWFFSGEHKCPEILLDWWSGQLDWRGYLVDGYPWQFRKFSFLDANEDDYSGFDQVAFIRKELKEHPNSRRLVMTTWNPGEMANITTANENSNTPTCCHGVVIQFFVEDGKLHMTHYQRSADMLLGVPHNFVQYWAMLLYFAHHAGLKPGSIQWLWGDAHIYDHHSHIHTAVEIIGNVGNMSEQPLAMVYEPTSIEFLAADFTIIGDIPKPLVFTKPVLF